MILILVTDILYKTLLEDHVINVSQNFYKINKFHIPNGHYPNSSVKWLSYKNNTHPICFKCVNAHMSTVDIQVSHPPLTYFLYTSSSLTYIADQASMQSPSILLPYYYIHSFIPMG